MMVFEGEHHFFKILNHNRYDLLIPSIALDASFPQLGNTQKGDWRRNLYFRMVQVWADHYLYNLPFRSFRVGFSFASQVTMIAENSVDSTLVGFSAVGRQMINGTCSYQSVCLMFPPIWHSQNNAWYLVPLGAAIIFGSRTVSTKSWLIVLMKTLDAFYFPGYHLCVENVVQSRSHLEYLWGSKAGVLQLSTLWGGVRYHTWQCVK